jgi:hypothetical protein
MAVSQPVVTKPSQNKGAGARDPVGPQNKTASSSFDFKDLRFPPEVGHVGKMLHWIKFIPCVQQKSGYNIKTDNTLGMADSNRQNLGGQLGSSADPFSGVAAAGVLAAGMGAIRGAESLAENLFSGDPAQMATAPVKALGAGAGGVLSGAFAGAVIGAIDLTRKTRRAAGSIALYMPDTVNQTIVNDYDQMSMTQALGKAGLIMQAGGSMTTAVLDSIVKGGTGQTTGSAAVSEVSGALAEKTGAFGSGITDALLFSAGYAQNPQVELLFKTIQNREFLFDFKFVPRNKSEAEEIIKIIQAFRFFAAPEIPTNGNGRYFIPPSEFDIQFMLGPDRNPNLPKLSTCVLQGIDVNYGSAGQWTAFQDGMPVEISMQLRFKEVEIMHKELVKQGF